jgi:uncharacterized protein
MAPPRFTWLEHLDEEECWELLAGSPVGRIGVLVDSAPEVYPVNHVVEAGTIVFRTDPGNTLRGIDRSPSVCFEVDHVDTAHRGGWSVLVKGRAEEVVDARAVRRAADLGLDFWDLGEKAHWIRIVPREVTGRRIGTEVSPPPGGPDGSA